MTNNVGIGRGNGKRTIQKILCELCGKEYSSVGIATHLKDTHKMTVDQYVEKIGKEFRINKLKKVEPENEVCLICNDGKKYSRSAIPFHIKKHNITKIDYVKQYILKGVVSKCKCGCGEEITIKTHYPYVTREFVVGHNSKGKLNSMYGKNVSTSTRKKMRLKALDRIEQYKTMGIVPPFITKESIETRGKIQTRKFLDRVEKEYDVIVLERNVEDDVLEFILRCVKCNHIFNQYHQGYFLCPSCNPRYRSNIEKEILNELQTIDSTLTIRHNDRRMLSNNKELDFLIPSHNLAIEFDGIYWHSELQGKDRTYHLKKTEECEKNGYQLLHIFEDEWILHKDIILGKISSLLNVDSRTTIYARKCDIKEISYKESKKFLDTHHLQGGDVSKFRIGLFYDDKLISVMTFGKQNASKGNVHNKIDGSYELSRYCTHSQYRCVGGASKLLKYFIRTHTPKHIISFADRRYSIVNKNVYETLGFTLSNITPPNYWYFKGSEMKRYHRFNFTKKKTIEMGGDPNKTEWENMITFGYDRIWDCGHLKYEMTI